MQYNWPQGFGPELVAFTILVFTTIYAFHAVSYCLLLRKIGRSVKVGAVVAVLPSLVIYSFAIRNISPSMHKLVWFPELTIIFVAVVNLFVFCYLFDEINFLKKEWRHLDERINGMVCFLLGFPLIGAILGLVWLLLS